MTRHKSWHKGVCDLILFLWLVVTCHCFYDLWWRVIVFMTWGDVSLSLWREVTCHCLYDLWWRVIVFMTWGAVSLSLWLVAPRVHDLVSKWRDRWFRPSLYDLCHGECTSYRRKHDSSFRDEVSWICGMLELRCEVEVRANKAGPLGFWNKTKRIASHLWASHLWASHLFSMAVWHRHSVVWFDKDIVWYKGLSLPQHFFLYHNISFANIHWNRKLFRLLVPCCYVQGLLCGSCFLATTLLLYHPHVRSCYMMHT